MKRGKFEYICVQKIEKCMHRAETSCMNECAYTYLASPKPLSLVSGAPQNLVLRGLKKRLIHQLISRACLNILANIA